MVPLPKSGARAYSACATRSSKAPLAAADARLDGSTSGGGAAACAMAARGAARAQRVRKAREAHAARVVRATRIVCLCTSPGAGVCSARAVRQDFFLCACLVMLLKVAAKLRATLAPAPQAAAACPQEGRPREGLQAAATTAAVRRRWSLQCSPPRPRWAPPARRPSRQSPARRRGCCTQCSR